MTEIKANEKLKRIRITKETEDLNPKAVLKNGQKKVYGVGHNILAIESIANLYLKAKVAEEVGCIPENTKDMFNQTKKED